jgi:hypothetical protein
VIGRAEVQAAARAARGAFASQPQEVHDAIEYLEQVLLADLDRIPEKAAQVAPGEPIDTPEFRKLSFAYAEALMRRTVPQASKAWAALVRFCDSHVAARVAAAEQKITDEIERKLCDLLGREWGKDFTCMALLADVQSILAQRQGAGEKCAHLYLNGDGVSDSRCAVCGTLVPVSSQESGKRATKAAAEAVSVDPIEANEAIFELASRFFAWNADNWRKATQGTIGMPSLLTFTKAAIQAAQPETSKEAVSDLTTVPCPACKPGEGCDECHGQRHIIVSRSDLAAASSTEAADWLNLIVRDIAELDYSSDTVLDVMQVSEADLRLIVQRHVPQPPAGGDGLPLDECAEFNKKFPPTSLEVSAPVYDDLEARRTLRREGWLARAVLKANSAALPTDEKGAKA